MVVWEEEDFRLWSSFRAQFAELGKARGVAAEIAGVAELRLGRIGIEEDGGSRSLGGRTVYK